MEIFIITSSAASVGAKDGCDWIDCRRSVRKFLWVRNAKKLKYVNDI